MRAYALASGLTREQAVRVYSFETGGNGNHDMQSGLSASRPGSRAISTAIGYNQLLTTNSVELMAEQGHEFVKALAEKAATLSGPARKAMDHKVAVLKKMVAFTRTVPDDWSAHEKLANTPQGWAVHAMVLDIDVGPMLQTHKLLTSVIFARAKGYTRPLTAAELEMMNLTGDGTGLDMVTMPQAMREQVPTSNFFQRWRLRAQSGGDPQQHGGEATGCYRRADGFQLQRRAPRNARVLGGEHLHVSRKGGPCALRWVELLRDEPSALRLSPGRVLTSIRPEHELAVAFEIGAGPHVELTVLADEEQRSLRHFLRALQQQAGIVGAHLVGEGLAVLAVAIAHVRLQLPGRRRRGLRECGCRSAPSSAAAIKRVLVENPIIVILPASKSASPPEF